MSVRRSSVVSPRVVKMVAAVVVGLGVGTAVPPDPVSLPVVGSVSGLVVGGVGVAAGTALYLRGPRLLGSSGCGCSGDCDCA